jgi:hypothetical protein
MFSVRHCVDPGFAVRSESYPMDTWSLHEAERPGLVLFTFLNLISRLRVRGFTPPLARLIRIVALNCAQGNFTFSCILS